MNLASPSAGGPPAGQRAGYFCALVGIVAVGFYLRWHQLLDQILADDEWHAVRTAVRETYLEMFTSFSSSAVPLFSMIYKALADTIGGSELVFRLPPLLAGLALIVVFPWVLPAGILQSRGRVALAGLVAISPLLIYFSRYARPYAISVLFTTVGLFAFYRWWRREPGRWGTLVVVGGVLGPAFHLTTLTTAAAPFAWGFYEIWRGRAERSARELWRLGLLTGLLVILAVGPPLVFDFGAIDERAGDNRVEWLTFRESVPLLAGVDGLPSLVVLLGAVVGFGLLWRRQPRLAGLLTWASLLTALGTALSNANSVQVPIVFLRYSLWLAPFFLLLVALAIDALLERLPAPLSYPVLAFLLAGLFYLGPWIKAYGRINSWPHHAIFQYTYRDDSPFSYARRPPHIPDLYHQLGKEPAGSLRLAEGPFYAAWHNNPLTYYQEIHRQRVLAGMLGHSCDRAAINQVPAGTARLRLRNVVDLSRRKDLEAHDIDIVILHKNTFRELPRFLRNVTRVPTSDLPPENNLELCLALYRRSFGQPFYEDDTLIAYDVRNLPPVDPNPQPIFGDGFESGTTEAWSLVVPPP